MLEEIVTDYVSIGDYVLTGGELPAMVMVDATRVWYPGFLRMMNRVPRNHLKVICWNIRSTAARKSGWGKSSFHPVVR